MFECVVSTSQGKAKFVFLFSFPCLRKSLNEHKNFLNNFNKTLHGEHINV